MSRPAVLWLDNDPGYIVGFVTAANRAGFDVRVVRSVTEAEAALATRTFDAIIVDVMIPLSAAEQAAGYSGEATDYSHKTGLEFYKRRAKMLEDRMLVVVLTVRVDQSIRDEFLAAGLSPERFLTKMELNDARVFVAELKRRMTERYHGKSGDVCAT